MEKPSVRTIERKSVSSLVFEQLKQNILHGVWKAGEHLPSEKELVNQLGVSRISVREGLKQLSSIGLIETRHGEGTFVKTVEAHSYMSEMLPLMVLNRDNIIELIKYRKIIEVGTAALAVERADEADILALEENVLLHERYRDDAERAARIDLEFHLLIAKASRNPFIIKANGLIKDIFFTVMAKIVETMGTENGISFHKRILVAIKARDAEAAQALMTEHIDRTERAMRKVASFDLPPSEPAAGGRPAPAGGDLLG